MSDLTLEHVQEEVKGKHLGRLCAKCIRNIKYGTKYKGKVFRARYYNDCGQVSYRYACEKCVTRHLQNELKNIPNRIQCDKDHIKYLRKRRKDLIKMLSL